VRRLACVALVVAGCNAGTPSCPGAAPSVALFEGYCPGGEADRCYFNPKAMDGF
jgi:hypothetical protein